MRLRSSSSGGIVSDTGRMTGVLLPVLAPIVVGGVAIVLMKAGWLRGLFSSEEQSLRRALRLRQTILGNDKHAVAAALGPPQGSAGAASADAAFLAGTWYYRLDDRYRIALAIEFVDDVAAEARVLHVNAGTRVHDGVERGAFA